MKKNIFFVCAFFLCSCSHVEKKNQDVVIPNLTSFQSEEEQLNLSKLFTDFRLVKLETNDSCLIGRNGKILKRGSVFYIQSANDVLEFGSDGHFMRSLSRVGNAPHEYVKLYDYDVLKSGNSHEIWISTLGGIKIYDAETLAFKRGLDIEGHVNQFKYVNDNTIILVTPGEVTFKVCNANGEIRKEFMKKDLANSGKKIVQFAEYEDKVMYHLDDTQEAVIYDKKSDSLYIGNIFPMQEGMLTSAINKKYYEEYGYMEQPDKVAEEFILPIALRTWKDNVALTMRYPDGKCTITLFDGDKSKTCHYPTSLHNDIIPTADMLFLSTLICCDSDSGFLFMISEERKSGKELEEDNPMLLDVSGFEL